MDTYGYVRVSTKEQNEDRQMIAIIFSFPKHHGQRSIIIPPHSFSNCGLHQCLQRKGCRCKMGSQPVQIFSQCLKMLRPFFFRLRYL